MFVLSMLASQIMQAQTQLEYDTIRFQVPRYFYKIVISLTSRDTLLNKRYENK